MDNLQIQEHLKTSFNKLNNEFIKENIFWWAHSGTLLGMIRDNGLIENDDDIDMAITWKEFVKNRKKIEEIINKNGFYMESLALGNSKNEQFIKIKPLKPLFAICKGKEVIKYPYIDLMIAINKPSFEFLGLRYHFMKWIPTLLCLKKADIWRRISLFWIPTALLKTIYKSNLRKSLNKDTGEYVKYDMWMDKKQIYYKNEFILKSFLETKVWINKNYFDELNNWYGTDWNIKKSK